MTRRSRTCGWPWDCRCADDRVYAAGHKGGVTAFALQTGKVLWKAKPNAPLAGGTAVAR